MAKGGATTDAIGFLTVVNHEQHGLFGGYLLLNTLGRPLEFHCTTPLKPNRAQEILYGATLTPYLYCDQIGQSLVAKSTIEPHLVCTDLPIVLELRKLISTPVTLVLPLDEDATACVGTPPHAADRGLRVDRPHGGRQWENTFHVGARRLAVGPKHADDKLIVAERLATVEEHFDLCEPFDRIREAIQEAQSNGK